jgi:glutamyl-tRNA synthetase
MNVRTRFAPSPTGFLHVGGVRTALFAWLLAKHYGGQFILRIEDTDQERLVEGAVKAIIDDLKAVGIEIDEGPSHSELKEINAYWPEAPVLGGGHGPYVQSLRRDRYKKVAEHLIEIGAAYRCNCTKEELDAERKLQEARKIPPGYSGKCRNKAVPADSKHVIRLKIEHGKTISLQDLVKGTVNWQSLSLRDPVLLKSDGFPTYHLAVVVDDHEMEISHVIRADEWLPSTPIHIMLYDALGWEKPKFCHVAPVLSPTDGKKYSKRHGAVSVSEFIDGGYLPEALLNFLALIGWSPGEGDVQEIFTQDELIKKFSIEHVNKAGGMFATEKLIWMNGQYIRALSIEELQKRVMPFIEKAGIKADPAKIALILPAIQDRLQTLAEAPGFVEFLFVDKLEREMKSILSKGVDNDKAIQILSAAKDKLSATEFSIEALDTMLKDFPKELGLPTGAVLGAVRIATTGKKITPPLVNSLFVLGKELSLQRIQETIEILQQSLVNPGTNS